MKQRLLPILVAISLFSSGVFLACGDKFLVSSRGTRYEKAPAKRDPSAILIWSNPQSELPKGLASVAVNETLSRVGYRPTTVSTLADFEKALNRGGWDLVILGVTDASAVSKRLPPDPPVLLPVVFQPTDRQMKEARAAYEVVLKGPAKRDSFLSAVDEALAHRTRKSASLHLD